MNQAFFFAFLRHGCYHQRANIPSAWQPYGLDLQGIEQSRMAAETLNRFISDNQLQFNGNLYSSNLLRAWQTATEMNRHLKHPMSIESDSRLNERSMGALANLTVDEIDNILREDPRFEHPGFAWKSDSHFKLPFDGAESLMEAGQRVANFIQEKNRLITQPNSLQVFIGHGASFRHAAHLLGILEFDEIAKLSMHYAEPIVFKWDPQSQSFSKVFGDWKYRKPSAENQKEFTVYKRLNTDTVHAEVLHWID